MEYEKSLDDIKEEEWKSKRSLKHGQNRGAKLMGLSALMMNILLVSPRQSYRLARAFREADATSATGRHQ